MLNFTAIGKGESVIKLPDFMLKDSQLKPVAERPGELKVRIN